MDQESMILHKTIESPECTPSMIRSIVHKRPHSLNSLDSEGSTPLYIALRPPPRIELIHELLLLGADVNMRMPNEKTPFLLAIYHFRKSDALFDVIKLFVKFGSDINFNLRFFGTPLHTIIYHVKGDVLIKLVEFCLKKGLNTDHISGNFRSFLQHTCNCVQKLSSRLEISKIFLEFGVIPDKNSPIRWYCINLKKEINRYTVKFVMLLMQYLLINEIKTDICKSKGLVYSKNYATIIDLEVFSRKKCYKELTEYRNALIKELKMMLRDKIDESTTLFSFISVRCSSGLYYDTSEELVLYKALSIYHSKRYVCCEDLFQASFKQDAVESILSNMQIFAKKSISKPPSYVKVMLNSDEILEIASYLSRKDILNLTLAFLNPAEKNENFLVKRSFKRSRNSLLKDSYTKLIKRSRLKN